MILRLDVFTSANALNNKSLHQPYRISECRKIHNEPEQIERKHFLNAAQSKHHQVLQQEHNPLNIT